MSIHPSVRFMLLMPALLVWLSACSLPTTPTAQGQPANQQLTTTNTLADLKDAEKMGCVCKRNAAKWSLIALALRGTTGYKADLGTFSSLGACTAAKKRQGRTCQ